MESLFDAWKSRIPKYSEKFKEKLFQPLAQYGGGTEQSRTNLGKHFSNAYELYMYAFFLGLYKDEYSPFSEGEKKTDFSHHIQFWGSKANRLDRKDFTRLQDFMFMACVANSDVDFIALEKGELSVTDAVKALIHTMEGYTNGGLTIISERLDENPNYFLQPTSFLDLIINQNG